MRDNDSGLRMSWVVLMIGILAALTFRTTQPAAAQSELLPLSVSEVTTETPTEAVPTLQPVIHADQFLLLGTKALFDASDTVLVPDAGTATYRWDFTDLSYPLFGVEVVREFSQVGIHRATLTVVQGDVSMTVEQELFVYDRQLLMVTDLDVASTFDLVVEQAADRGVFLKVVAAESTETGFITEEELVPLIRQQQEFIADADGILFASRASASLQAFTRYWLSLEDREQIDLRGMLLVALTDGNLELAADIAQQSFEVVHPPFVLLTRREALNPIFETPDAGQVITTLSQRAIEYRVIDERSQKPAGFFLSHLVTRFISQGFPTNAIYLLLAFPFILFVVTFVRQVLGLSTFGIYTPAVVALTFLLLGLEIGLAVVTVVVATSTLVRRILERFSIPYVPKTALVLSFIGLSLLGILGVLSYARASLATSLAIFPMLVMSTVGEKFISIQSESGLRGAFWAAVQTVVTAVGAYYFVVWTSFQDLILSWPELVIVPLLAIILLGRFSGLRVMEYVRFRSLLRERDSEGTEE